MCATCGCEPDDPHHHHRPPMVLKLPSRTVSLEVDLLAKNDGIAAENRAWMAERGVTAVNLMSSPGSGKTTLVERTVRALMRHGPVAVIEGDQATERDAERIRATGCRAVQIQTGAGCHLDADMVRRGLRELDPPRGAVVLIENVGNLVCPAMFDLGERARVVVASVTEGEDKPAKYPHMFRAAELMVLNKIDLLPHLSFSVEDCLAHAREVNPRLRFLRLSALTGEGLDPWCDWLREVSGDR